MSFFGHDLRDGYRLALRDGSTDAAMHRLTLANLDRLRRREAWAQQAPTSEETEAYTRVNLRAYAEGSMMRSPNGSVARSRAPSARPSRWAGSGTTSRSTGCSPATSGAFAPVGRVLG